MRKYCGGENSRDFEVLIGFSLPENENMVFGMPSLKVLSNPVSR
jgi:hypothetical protein